jgi:sugar phosphate isomerase/epimerase
MILGTVLLEPNRWSDRDRPLLRWDWEWSERVADGGFDGLEIWENHWFLGDTEARSALRGGPCPARIFNWYGCPGEQGEDSLLEAVSELSGSLIGVKFNIPRGDPSDCARRIVAAGHLQSRLPSGIRLLCECHKGTLLETPEAARGIFQEWPPQTGAILHPFNEDSAVWLEVLGERIVHLHLQASERGEWMDPAPGVVPVDAGIRALTQSAFHGSATLEFVAGVATERDPATLLESAKRVRSAWRNAGGFAWI